jgi:hypothetical protein
VAAGVMAAESLRNGCVPKQVPPVGYSGGMQRVRLAGQG